MLSSKTLNVVLGSISYDAETSTVLYRVIQDGEDMVLAANASDMGGIRTVIMSDELERFLRRFCQEDPKVIKRLVKTTWRVIDGEALEFPFQV